MIKIMEADKTVGPGGLIGKFLYKKTGSIRGQNRFGRTYLIEFFKKISFYVLVLKNSLYDQIGIGNSGEVCGPANA